VCQAPDSPLYVHHVYHVYHFQCWNHRGCGVPFPLVYAVHVVEVYVVELVEMVDAVHGVHVMG
jgi:hypothetical protein